MRTFRHITLHDYIGGVGLFMVMIVSLLLMTTTTIAARMAMSESRQASEVDQSDAAYYAAEAGIMEAAHRIDVDSERSTDITGGSPTPLEEIFPEQYEHGENGGDRHGDRAVLGEFGNNFATGSQLDIEPDRFDEHSEVFGQIAWRQRQVYEEPRMPFGTQVKDESVELDLTSLRQLCDPQGFGGDNDDYAGEDGQDCDGNDIFALMDGMEYCWSRDVPGAARPEFEVTILSYPSGNATNIATDKVKVDANTSSGVSVAPGVMLQMSSSDGSYEHCMEFEFSNSNRRYIFRIKPLFDGVNAQVNPDGHRVDYQTRLLHDDPQDRPLFIARNTVIIDSVGQSGETRRRIVARKDRDGRVLGIFDFTLYSGGSGPLCKPGVQQDDVVYYEIEEFCRVDGADN